MEADAARLLGASLADAGRLIGAGLAVIGFAGVGVGIGNVFSTMISSVARNPAAAPNVQLFMWIGFALVEAVAFYGLLVVILIAYVI